MKAMVFAAGLGSRLGDLTADRPKALIEVGGEALLSIVLSRLREAGVRDVIINTHHHAGRIESFIEQSGGFELNIAFSHEESLLDTGGGLKRAGWFFDDDRPFLMHNVDVLSDVDLGAMMAAHEASGALATLAAKPRLTARPLLFDENARLCGRVFGSAEVLSCQPSGRVERLGFCGIHAASPELLTRLTETGAFSIVDAYLRLVSEGSVVRVHRVDGNRWRDCGRPADLLPL